MLLYKYEHRMMPNNCTKYEQNHHILFWYIPTNSLNLWKMNIITQICHKASAGLIMVPIMKKIWPAIIEANMVYSIENIFLLVISSPQTGPMTINHSQLPTEISVRLVTFKKKNYCILITLVVLNGMCPLSVLGLGALSIRT